MSSPRNDQWLPIERPGDYDRLLRLARRRLIGFEHFADDVVSRALIKWSGLPDDQRRNGFIEQVIKTEAYSMLRSEDRRANRQHRSAEDPAIGRRPQAEVEADRRQVELRMAVAQTCRRLDVRLGPLDLEVFELILAGMNLADVERSLGVSRYQIRKSRKLWQRILKHVLLYDAD